MKLKELIMRHALIAAAALLVSACGSDEPTSPASPVIAEPEFRELPGTNRWVMIIPAGLPVDQWKGVAKEKCGAESFCQVFGWTNSAEAPQTFPMTEREMETQAFFYGVNRASGFESTVWDCSRYQRPAPDECI